MHTTLKQGYLTCCVQGSSVSKSVPKISGDGIQHVLSKFSIMKMLLESLCNNDFMNCVGIMCDDCALYSTNLQGMTEKEVKSALDNVLQQQNQGDTK